MNTLQTFIFTAVCALVGAGVGTSVALNQSPAEIFERRVQQLRPVAQVNDQAVYEADRAFIVGTEVLGSGRPLPHGTPLQVGDIVRNGWILHEIAELEEHDGSTYVVRRDASGVKNYFTWSSIQAAWRW